jgi:hypothetical protein
MPAAKTCAALRALIETLNQTEKAIRQTALEELVSTGRTADIRKVLTALDLMGETRQQMANIHDDLVRGL